MVADDEVGEGVTTVAPPLAIEPLPVAAVGDVAGGSAGFVSSVCFDITTVVVFWILSWSGCSDGDLGGPEVNASAARTISNTCNGNKWDIKFEPRKAFLFVREVMSNHFW